MTPALIVHSLAAIVWVGGMFFAYAILRPTVQAWQPLDRLKLWQGVFQRFFPWVWASVLVLPASGYFMIFSGLGGFSGAGLHVHVMHPTGWIMILLFLYLFHVPWLAFRRAVDQQDLPAAAARLAVIRRIVAVNLALGLLTAAIGASGRYWG
jgi:uncharacterized membrane protein